MGGEKDSQQAETGEILTIRHVDWRDVNEGKRVSRNRQTDCHLPLTPHPQPANWKHRRQKQLTFILYAAQQVRLASLALAC